MVIFAHKTSAMDSKQSTAHRLYGLVGYPLGHSFSQRFFNEKFAAENIDAEYLNFEISDINKLREILTTHPDLCGFNVTIPHKEAVMPLLTDITPQAKEIGAVNVVKVTRDHDSTIRLQGFNTDVSGFAADISRLIPARHAGMQALVLGTGGASKAVVAGLKSLDIDPVTVSRTAHRGALTYPELTADIISRTPIIVNTTPLGMHPNVDTCPPINYSAITQKHLCYDVVYNPAMTLFMTKCAARGAIVACGIGMLHNQANDAWRIWNTPDR